MEANRDDKAQILKQIQQRERVHEFLYYTVCGILQEYYSR